VAGDLQRQAREFAEDIQRILNTTICTGVRIAARPSTTPGYAVVGYGISRSSDETLPFPVHIGSRKPRCWLHLGYELSLDKTGRFLTVFSSFFSVQTGPQEASCLCHFDYERDKPGGYPEAHLQVNGVSPALASWPGKTNTRELGRLHFPVGGRRFRPTVEDVIEFLIVEGLAEPREGWRTALDARRRDWERIQLRAAMRSDPESSAELLGEFGEAA
jgi:hypothetical protein